jgi:hypothetical protein
MQKVKTINTLDSENKDETGLIKKAEDCLDFDEEEQARLFKEAVEEFRKGKPKESATISETNYLPVNKKRDCCWTCFKVILEESSLQEIFEDKIMKIKVVIFLIYNRLSARKIAQISIQIIFIRYVTYVVENLRKGMENYLKTYGSVDKIV